VGDQPEGTKKRFALGHRLIAYVGELMPPDEGGEVAGPDVEFAAFWREGIEPEMTS
jgi:hypothetical protein